MTVDFLIVGQGLAGSLIAWELMQRHCKVLVIDNGGENASQIAAGLINPITGMRLVKSSDVDLLLPIAKCYYQTLEQFFHQRFYIEKPMLRLFKHKKELNTARNKCRDSGYQDYLGDIKTTSELNAPFGFITQKQTGYLLTQPLLTALKDFFINQHSYQQCQFNYADITLGADLHWQGITCKKIIFCEGYQVCHNPWFSQLPFQPVKGEILTLSSATPLPGAMLNYGHWFIPLAAGLFRTGATFDHELDTLCTEIGKNNLLNSLQKILPMTKTATLIKHQANIRPCTLDKSPFIGQHPLHPQLLLFNGFGAKGSLQIPYYSQQLADYMLQNKPLATKVDIARLT
jgi:glycine/D-amino acid oxidase-like deaminating enzyme